MNNIEVLNDRKNPYSYSNIFTNEKERKELIKNGIKNLNLTSSTVGEINVLDQLSDDDYFDNDEDKKEFLNMLRFSNDDQIRAFNITVYEKLANLMKFDLEKDEETGEYINLDMFADIVITTKNHTESFDKIENQQKLINKMMSDANDAYDNALLEYAQFSITNWKNKVSDESMLTVGDMWSMISTLKFESINYFMSRIEPTEDSQEKFISKLTAKYTKAMTNPSELRKLEKRFIAFCIKDPYAIRLGLDYPNIKYILVACDKVLGKLVKDEKDASAYHMFVSSLICNIYLLTSDICYTKRMGKKRRKIKVVKTGFNGMANAVLTTLYLFKLISEDNKGHNDVEKLIIEKISESMVNSMTLIKNTAQTIK